MAQMGHCAGPKNFLYIVKCVCYMKKALPYKHTHIKIEIDLDLRVQ